MLQLVPNFSFRFTKFMLPTLSCIGSFDTAEFCRFVKIMQTANSTKRDPCDASLPR